MTTTADITVSDNSAFTVTFVPLQGRMVKFEVEAVKSGTIGYIKELVVNSDLGRSHGVQGIEDLVIADIYLRVVHLGFLNDDETVAKLLEANMDWYLFQLETVAPPPPSEEGDEKKSSIGEEEEDKLSSLAAARDGSSFSWRRSIRQFAVNSSDFDMNIGTGRRIDVSAKQFLEECRCVVEGTEADDSGSSSNTRMPSVFDGDDCKGDAAIPEVKDDEEEKRSPDEVKEELACLSKDSVRFQGVVSVEAYKEFKSCLALYVDELNFIRTKEQEKRAAFQSVAPGGGGGGGGLVVEVSHKMPMPKPKHYSSSSYSSNRVFEFAAPPSVYRVPQNTTVYGMRLIIEGDMERILNSNSNEDVGEGEHEDAKEEQPEDDDDQFSMDIAPVLPASQDPGTRDSKDDDFKRSTIRRLALSLSACRHGSVDLCGMLVEADNAQTIAVESDERERELIADVVGDGRYGSRVLVVTWPEKFSNKQINLAEWKAVEKRKKLVLVGNNDAADDDEVSTDGVLRLTDCLKKFAKREQLSETESWYCGKCKVHVPAFKTMNIWRAPPIMVFHLKRFVYVDTAYGNRKEKLENHVTRAREKRKTL